MKHLTALLVVISVLVAGCQSTDGTNLEKLGRQNLGVAIADDDWRAVATDLCAGRLLRDVVPDFRERHPLDAPDAAIIDALRAAAEEVCPDQPLR